jgi:hypothetical protein
MTTTGHPSDEAPRRAARDAQRTAYAMRALGKRGLPVSINVDGTTYRLERDVKHDFFAATGFYLSDDGRRVVAKFGRSEDFLGLPLRWLGNRLRDRELRMYDQLRDVSAIPSVLGTVEPCGFVLAFVEGQPLRKDARVPDGFFHELRYVIEQIHARGVAYVDMNKKANVIIGRDGKPNLVDFQISFDLRGAGDNLLTRRILAHLQREDLYHVRKHHARFRPDELTPEQLAAAERRSLLIRLHRLIRTPWIGLRRRTWKRLRETGRLLPEGSE